LEKEDYVEFFGVMENGKMSVVFVHHPPHFHGTLFCANFCSSYATGKLVSIFEGCREWRPQHFNLLSIIHMARPESRQRTMAEKGNRKRVN